jgi:hypothetical protein
MSSGLSNELTIHTRRVNGDFFFMNVALAVM